MTRRINAFGVEESREVEENSLITDSVSRTVDGFGRPLITSFLDGTSSVCSEYKLWGPRNVTGVDGSTSSFEYNGHGRVSKKTDASVGVVSDFQYDAMGNVTKVTVSGGGAAETEEYAYDSLGRLTALTDKFGGKTSVDYAATDFGVRMTASLPAGGGLVEETYFDGSPKQVSGSAAPARVCYEYGVIDGVFFSKVSNAGNADENVTVRYDFLGNPAFVKRSGSPGETALSYDHVGRPTGSSDESGIRRIVTYNTANNRVEHAGVDADGDGLPGIAGSDPIVSYARNLSPNGVRQEIATYPTHGDPAAVKPFARETSFNGLSGSISVFGRQSTFSRTGVAPMGTYSVTAENSDATTTTLEYEKWRPKTVRISGGGATSKKTEYGYDGLGRLEQVRKFRNQVARSTGISRDGQGRVTSVSGPCAADTLYVSYYNSTDRISRITKADGRSVSYAYDDAGRLIREFDMGATDKRYGYDDLGRLTRLTTYGGTGPRVTVWHYSNAGLLVSKTINGAVAETYSHRDNGQLRSVTDANNVTATVSYDSAGNASGLAFTDGTAAIASTLDRLGRPLSVGAAGGISLAYARAADGQLLSETVTGNGVVSDAVVSRTYPDHGHDGVTGIACSVAGGTPSFCSISYGPDVRVSGVSNGTVSAAYLYAEDSPLATSVTVSVQGRLLTRSVKWDYDAVLPRSVAYTMSGAGAVESFEYGYEPGSGRVAQETYLDGTSRTYEYDDAGRLTDSETLAAGGGTPIPGLRFGWRFDGNNNVLRAGPKDGYGRPRYSFECDGRDVQVSRAWGRSFVISGRAAAGATVTVCGSVAERQGERFSATVRVNNSAGPVRTNIVVTAFRHDDILGKDVVACATGVLFVARAAETPAYDNRASLTGDSRYTYEWDAFGRLTGAVCDVAPKKKVEFAYYPDGRRAVKKVYRQSGQSWALVRTHRFYYDGWNLACESLTPAGSSEPAVFSRYLWGLDLAGQRDGKFGQAAGGIGGLLAVTVTSNGADRVCLPVSDAAGNIRKVVDASTGAVVAEYAYDPYGVPLEIGGAAAGVCPFRFQTKYFDAETGLYYFGYRYYDPLSCKWLCRDPLQENGGVNLTAYCDNDPVNKYDALGLEAYIVYRNFADSPPGGKLKSRGHFFLAFDDKNLEDVEAWQALVRGLGKYTPAGDRSAVYNPPGTPMNRIKKEDLPDPQAETFSFHPWSVYDESEGAAYSLFGSTRTSLDVTLTCGSYIGYGDDVDRRAFRNARDGGGDTHARTAIVFPLKLTDQQQANLYRAAIQSRNINNRSPESRDTSAYILGVFNCGSWTYKMLAEKGIPYPAAAQRLNRIPGLEHIPVAGMLSGGVGVRGMADYTGIPQASTVLIGTVGVVYQAGGLAVGVTTHSAQRVTTMGSWLIQNAEVLPNSADVGSTSTLGGLARWRFY